MWCKCILLSPRQKNWPRRFSLCLIFPSPVCRILGSSSFTRWTNREVSALNSAEYVHVSKFSDCAGYFFPSEREQRLANLSRLWRKEILVAGFAAAASGSGGKGTRGDRLTAALSKDFKQHMAVEWLFAASTSKGLSLLKRGTYLGFRPSFDCLLQTGAITRFLLLYLLCHCVSPAKFPLLCLSKIYHSDKVVVQVLLQEGENLTSCSLDFPFLSHFDAISSS